MRAHVRERAANEGLGLVGPDPERRELTKKKGWAAGQSVERELCTRPAAPSRSEGKIFFLRPIRNLGRGGDEIKRKTQLWLSGRAR